MMEQLRTQWPGLRVYIKLDDTDVFQDVDGETYQRILGYRIEFDKTLSRQDVEVLITHEDADAPLPRHVFAREELRETKTAARDLTLDEQRYEKGLSIQVRRL